MATTCIVLDPTRLSQCRNTCRCDSFEKTAALATASGGAASAAFGV